MAYKVSSTVTIDNNRKAFCTRLNPGSSAPGSPSAGDIYYDSTVKALRVYDGSIFKIV